MSYFLKRALLSSPRNSSLIPVVAVAVAGSGLFYAKSNPDSFTRVSLLIPAPFLESLQVPWRVSQDLFQPPSLLSSDPAQLGNLPLFSSRVSPTPPVDVLVAAGDNTKSHDRYLGRDSFANAAARVGPAVVHISVAQVGPYGINAGSNMGSGTIIDADGTILTCAHLVVGSHGVRGLSKGKVDVTLQDGRTFEAKVLNADLHSDIAIIKINSKTPLPTAKCGSSSKLRPGDWVIALGCPLSLQNTVTAGIISCVDRKSSDLGLAGMHREYLQTDCAINPGNSGGPLVNIDGEIVGVNIMKRLAADGLGFAVPIDAVSKIMEQFKRNGRVVRPWLGLKMVDLDGMMIAQLKERDASFPNIEKGVLVAMVTPGSPADRAGFRLRDVVIEFDGKPVESIKEIIKIMGDRTGKPMKVFVTRANNDSVTLTVIPEEANPDM
ncbi:putative protease Do-like 14 [Carica papaya]|uniref:putative protease Do-like 14 n=1 Tax=Carica papaya TaxID=3649 RepID=UPI000B8C736F|nr:putative protease Do-like 14 [Carica papaya]